MIGVNEVGLGKNRYQYSFIVYLFCNLSFRHHIWKASKAFSYNKYSCQKYFGKGKYVIRMLIQSNNTRISFDWTRCIGNRLAFFWNIFNPNQKVPNVNFPCKTALEKQIQTVHSLIWIKDNDGSLWLFITFMFYFEFLGVLEKKTFGIFLVGYDLGNTGL